MKTRRLLTAAFAASILASCGDCEKDPGASFPDISVPDSSTQPDVGSDASSNSARQAVLSVEQSGEFVIEALQGPVHVVRTAGNVPHIYASNRHDMYVAEGFILAQDRYFEFDIARRLALGRVSELLGGFGLTADMQARGQGMTYVADRILEHLDEETAAVFDAYAEGINAYIDAAKAGTLPPPTELELTKGLLGVANAADAMERADRRSIAGFAAFAVFNSSHVDTDLMRTLSANQIEGHFAGKPDEALRQAGLESDLTGRIAPVHKIAVVPGWGLNGALQQTLSFNQPPSTTAKPIPALPVSMRDRIEDRSRRMEALFRFGHQGDHGSNAWAVSSSKTADGATLLAGDGHLSLGIPPIFFQMGLDTSVFGEGDDFSVMGLFLPGFPFLAVGTNGDIAWSQTYPRADVIDWYREEIRLSADGEPAESFFEGSWRPLQRVEETYHVAGVLGGDERDETWARWMTFDGRWINDIEGRVIDPDTETPGPGEAVVTMLGDLVVPADTDDDGVITAISADYTAYDIGNLAATVAGFQEARSVEEFQSGVANFVGYAQNLITADAAGHIGFTPFTATPCRDYLPRDADGRFQEGADPTFLLDGTRFGGFEIPVDADGNLAPDSAGDDPYKCTIPFEDFPRAFDPAEGWVANANNDPAGTTFDDNFGNDPWYIGGPWVPGYRARAITMALEELTANSSADIASMAEIQGHHGSQVGEEYVPVITAAIDRAKTLSTGSPSEPHEQRLAAAWDERFAEVQTRLDEWVAAGAPAKSGVQTFYANPTDADREHAVATMIFNAWFRQYLLDLFDDEEIAFVFQPPSRQRGTVMRVLELLHRGRGAGNPADLASWNPATEESIFFDDLTTAEIERSDEIVLRALTKALDGLTAPETRAGVGGFGTAEMDDWLWGLRHQVRLESILAEFAAGNPAVNAIAGKFAIDTKRLPLADSYAEDDPRRRLRWFPRDGDLFGVDAANPSFFGEDFTYANGPVMRMVIALGADGSVKGQNIIPGGQSGLTDSPHYDDQARLWLGNDTLPMHFEVEDVVAGATGRELLRPE